MSRLIVGVTAKEHQTIKTLAAMEGKTIKEYVLERVLPGNDPDEAWQELEAFLESRIANATQRGTSTKTVAEITEETLEKFSKN